MALTDSCGNNLANISRTNCTVNQKLIKGFLVYTDQSTQLEYADIAKATIKTQIQEGKAFYFPRVTGATDNTGDIAINVNDYGVSRVGSTAINTSISFEVETSACMLDNLLTWNKVKVVAYPIYEDGSLGGYDVENTYFKGQASMFVFQKAKYKTNRDDDPQTTMIWLADNDQIRHSVTTDFILDLDGIVDVKAAISGITTSELTVDITEECNGTGIEGLDFSDFSVTLANGTVVAPTAIVDNTGGNYTLTVATTSGTNSLGFSAVSIALTGTDKLVGLSATSFVTP